MTNQEEDKRSKDGSEVAEQQQPSSAARAKLNAQDKTRIALNARSKADSNDKTRIAGKTEHEDKTRIARPSARPRGKSNATSGVASTSEARQDKTRIATKSAPSKADATRFKPSNRQSNRPKTNNQPSTQPASKSQSPSADKQNLLKERFVLEKVLGAGGMGVVYKAKDLVKVEAGDKDPYLAVKVLGDEFKEHPEAFIALQRESRKTQRIAHPNIVNVHDFDRDGDTVFMTMEYLDGQPLDELIRKYKSTGLPTEDADSILKSICQALIYAHQQDIIHSDFKPGNIFVTDKGDTKVFDFGIARAVAKAEQYEENLEDKTIFDAGDLGALTPAYASYEMLEGQEPDVRDDIYALGCVAYELYTGSHPFNKVPADEAKKQNLKPKRINNIPKRQWKVIEKALAFERANRVETVHDFLRLYTSKRRSLIMPFFISIIMVAALAGVYLQYFGNVDNGISETEIRSELEFTLRFENYRNAIDDLIISKDFTSSWEDSLWKQYSGVKALLGQSERWLTTAENEEFRLFLTTNVEWFKQLAKIISDAYLQQIRQQRLAGKLQQAQSLVNNAVRYEENIALLEKESELIESDMLAANLAAEKEAERIRLLAQEKAEKLKKQKLASQDKPKSVKKSAKQLRDDQFNSAMSNVQTQLKCQANKLNMRNLDTAVKKLRSVNQSRYKEQEKTIVSLLVSCISNIGKVFPERANEYKKDALRLFTRNRNISGIVIIPRDPCSRSLAGLGARGKRATCSDSLANLGDGPELVVIPATKGIRAFAIGKYEVSIKEFNVFCKSSKRCKEISTSNTNLPVANLPIKLAEEYLRWLSDKSKQKYRLPSLKEWSYAAKAKNSKLDPNRNCQVNTRGITKGDKFDRVTVGRHNTWGLVNYVGNAGEWVYDIGRKLLAVGGSYNIPLERCDINTKVEHSGNADEVTGFRVLREVK